MKVIYTVFVSLTLIIGIQTSSVAEVEVSVTQSQVEGNADFWWYYPSPNPNVISQLHAPQTQTMTLYEFKYVNDKGRFLKLSYGTSENNNKGRGFDADWTDENDYSKVTYYGTMNFYGKQENIGIDYGFVVFNEDNCKTTVFLGWSQHKSTNEIRDVIYYIINGINLTVPRSQNDIGAFYDMNFRNYRAGVEHVKQINSKLSVTGIVSVMCVDANLKAEWTNHDPVWKFKDRGLALGYELNVNVAYEISKNVSVNLGYNLYYAKAKGCTRYLDSGNGYEMLSQPVDLELNQHGYVVGITAKF